MGTLNIQFDANSDNEDVSWSLHLLGSGSRNRGSVIRFPTKKEISFSSIFRKGNRTHRDSYLVGTGCSFHRDKTKMSWRWPSTSV